MKSVDWYKDRYGKDGDELRVDTFGRIDIPYYLVRMVIDLHGLKSKKRRIIMKKVKKFVHNAVRVGVSDV